MTLVIAGYNNRDGIFFASDSAISSGTSILLGGFKKVYSVAVKLWEPDFAGEYFRGYSRVNTETQCSIAFSGGTLTAQHILNSISEHLGNLHISYESSRIPLNPGRYVIVMPCQSNELRDQSRVRMWADDMFTRDDCRGILTADYIAKIIEHSINHAVRSARKYRLDQRGFDMLMTDFAAGIRCPLTSRFYLYLFRMRTRDGKDGTPEAYTVSELIPSSGVAVLGLRERFEANIQAQLNIARAESRNIPIAMFEYLNKAIDIIKSEGHRLIDRPSRLRMFDERGLYTIQRRPADE